MHTHSLVNPGDMRVCNGLVVHTYMYSVQPFNPKPHHSHLELRQKAAAAAEERETVLGREPHLPRAPTREHALR